MLLRRRCSQRPAILAPQLLPAGRTRCGGTVCLHRPVRIARCALVPRFVCDLPVAHIRFQHKLCIIITDVEFPRSMVSIALARSCTVCALLCALACVGALDSESSTQGEKEEKEQCVSSEELELIKEGMMLVYGNQEKEAAGWFREKCYNGTEGSLSTSCTCLYWAFRAHTVRTDALPPNPSLTAPFRTLTALPMQTA
jgi:hypothetical protein